MGNKGREEGWYRRNIGRKIELGVNRLIGTFLLLIAGIALLLTLSSDSFAFASHWPTFLVAALLLYLARLCFRAKGSIIQGFGDDTDVPVRRHKDRD